MKKILFTAAVSALCILSACTGQGNVSTQPSEQPQQTSRATAEPTKAPAELLQAGSTSAAADGWTEVSKYRYDVDADGERETIRLYTDAQRSENGELMWDDSQKWVLEMADGSNIFTLYSGAIHNGMPYFEVYEDKDGRICIGLTVSSGAGYEIKKFVYIKDKKAFEIENVYSEDGINQLYTSLQAY